MARWRNFWAASKREATQPTRAEFTSKVSFVLSIFAFLFSTLSFLYQYIPHEKLTYVLTKPAAATLDPQPGESRTYYVQSALTLFNRGNATASLISATGVLIESKNRGENVGANDECSRQHGVYRTLPPIEFVSSSYPYRPYSGVVEQSKILLIPMMFALRTGKEIQAEKIDGLVCLSLKVADSDGRIFDLSRPLINVSIENKDGSRFVIETRLEQDYLDLEKPQDVYDRVHLRSPF